MVPPGLRSIPGMGVRLSYKGHAGVEGGRAEAFRFARRFAHDMQWAVQPLSQQPRAARLGDQVLERPRLEGLALIPHFACEPLPLVFAGEQGTLVDSFLGDPGSGTARMNPEPMVKTQFAGLEAHEEICRFLDELKQGFVADLEVDDETGFHETRDRSALQAHMDRGWERLAARIRASGLEPGRIFQVAGFEFEVPRSGSGEPEEFAEVDDEVRDLIRKLEGLLMTRYSGMGLELDRTRRSVEDLDLLMMEADEEGLAKRPEDPETEAFVHQVGAYFGRTVVRELGGTWKVRGEEGVELCKVGGVGLRLNPFEIATGRLLQGPAYGFGLHLHLFDHLVRWVPA